MKDPYILENGTLRNLLGIEEYKELKRAEADIGFAKLINVESVNNDELDVELIRRIHKHIFEDIFEWAGEYRTTPLFKAERFVIPGLSINYTRPDKIETELLQSFHELNGMKWKGRRLEEISLDFAKHLARIWKVHPFRDGNTRTLLSFACIYAAEHGYPMDKTVFLNKLARPDLEDERRNYSVRDYFVFATLDPEHYPEPEYLASLIQQAIISENRKRKQREVEK